MKRTPPKDPAPGVRLGPQGSRNAVFTAALLAVTAIAVYAVVLLKYFVAR